MPAVFSKERPLLVPGRALDSDPPPPEVATAWEAFQGGRLSADEFCATIIRLFQDGTTGKLTREIIMTWAEWWGNILRSYPHKHYLLGQMLTLEYAKREHWLAVHLDPHTSWILGGNHSWGASKDLHDKAEAREDKAAAALVHLLDLGLGVFFL